jgi:hypothetical protein
MDSKKRLRQLRGSSRKRWLIFSIAVIFLLAWVRLVDWYFYVNFNFLFARRVFVKRTAQRAHWVGAQVSKPHYLAFAALVIVLLSGLFNAPHIQHALYWSLSWGITFAVFVIYRSTLTIVRRISNQVSHSLLYQRTQN